MPDSTVSRTLLIRPIGGMWTLDQPQDVPEGASPDMLNFQVYNGYLRKRPGLTPYGNTFPTAPICGLFSAQNSLNGQRFLVACTTTNMWFYNTAITGWSILGGPALNGGVGELFSFEVSQNNIVFCQGVDQIMAAPLVGGPYAPIAGSVPSKYLTRWNNRLYTANTVEGGVNLPFRVRWSVSGDHTDWAGLGSGFVDLNDEPSQLTGIRKLLNYMAVYAERCVYIATKTGSITGPAQFDMVVKDIGLLVPFTLRGYNTHHFLLSSDNLSIFDGTKLTPTSPNVRTTMFAQLSSSNFTQGSAVENLGTQEFVCFIVVDPSTVINAAWVYNWQRDVTYPWSLPDNLYNYCTSHISSIDLTIAQLIGTIGALTGTIGARHQDSAFPLIILGEVTGRVMQMTNTILYDDVAGVQTSIPCRWTSKDFTTSDIDPSATANMLTLTSVAVTYIDPGSVFTLNFSYSVDRGNTWQGPYPLTVGGVAAGAVGDAMVTQQVTGRRVRFKVENNTVGEDPRIINFQPCLELRRQKVA